MTEKLTDVELHRAAGQYARLRELNKRAYVLPETLDLARLASAAASELLELRARHGTRRASLPRPMARLIDITNLTDAALDVVLAVRGGEAFVECGHLTVAERGQVVEALGCEMNARTRAWVAGPPPVRDAAAPGRDVEGLILAEQGE